MLDLADRLSSSNGFCSPGFQSFLRKNILLMLQDGEYSCTSVLTRIKARFVNKLLGEDCNYYSEIVKDVVEEVTKIAERGSVSHLVIYGNNRTQVLTIMLCHHPAIMMFPIILSENVIEKEQLIAARIGNKISVDKLKSLPDVLDFPFDLSFGTSPELLEKLYVSGRLFQPYQVDTDRYPFSRRYI